MRLRHTSLITALLLLVVMVAWVGPAFAKKPVGAYIQSAKIAIVESRPEEGIVMLDSLLMLYGPHAEGYYWMTLVHIDMMNATPNLNEKKTWVEKIVTYTDSLHLTCESKDVKDKYKKDCDKFKPEIDSLNTYYWRTFYNAGVEQIREVEKVVQDLANSTDSAELAYFQTRLNAQIDSCIDNMQLAIIIDKSDSRTYTGIASAYEEMGDYATANRWLDKALVYATDSTSLLQKAAYNEINGDKYCDAIPYFDAYVRQISAKEGILTDSGNVQALLGSMYNMSVCLNNCDHYDSAYVIFQKMVALDPNNADGLVGSGRYHNQLARYANDSANYYRDNKDTVKSSQWTTKKIAEFTQALEYFRRAYQVQPNDTMTVGEYALVAALVQKFDEAAEGFRKLTELEPENAEHWASLGDCYVPLKEWQKAADAYEKSLTMQPKNKSVLEQLVLLYDALKQPARKAEAEKKLKNL